MHPSRDDTALAFATLLLGALGIHAGDGRYALHPRSARAAKSALTRDGLIQHGA